MGIVLAIACYVSALAFGLGMCFRLWRWVRKPVLYNMPTTPGPRTIPGVVGRLVAEIVLFRSLFRGRKDLWALSWCFHVAFLLIVLRHSRYFLYPVPDWSMAIQTAGYYAAYVLAACALYLLMRRFYDNQTAYVSLNADYLILLLFLGIAGTGLTMRYYAAADLVYIKNFVLGLLAFQPQPLSASWLFDVHLLLVAALVAYFPFSKLVHVGAAVFSPSRNQRNIARELPPSKLWDFPVN